MTLARIAPVVEGYGDVEAVPILLRRISQEIFDRYDVQVHRPFRVPRGRINTAHLSSAARVMAASAGSRQVLVVVDADDDCAVNLADEIRLAAGPVEVEVAVAVREFEAWFLAALPSLASHRAVADASDLGRDFDTIRDAKGLLGQRMSEHYRETLHQPAMAAVFDLEEARRSRSFEHLVGCVGRLIGEADLTSPLNI